MSQQIIHFPGNSPFVIDYEKVLKTYQEPMTIKSLGIELPREKPFTKIDFDRDLGKVARKVKK